jgi:hypothetical protein
MPTSGRCTTGGKHGGQNESAFYWLRRVTWLSTAATMRSESKRALCQLTCLIDSCAWSTVLDTARVGSAIRLRTRAAALGNFGTCLVPLRAGSITKCRA